MQHTHMAIVRGWGCSTENVSHSFAEWSLGVWWVWEHKESHWGHAWSGQPRANTSAHIALSCNKLKQKMMCADQPLPAPQKVCPEKEDKTWWIYWIPRWFGRLQVMIGFLKKCVKRWHNSQLAVKPGTVLHLSTTWRWVDAQLSFSEAPLCPR